jgi:polyhydroxyalkanoate synthesis regulator phasin
MSEVKKLVERIAVLERDVKVLKESAVTEGERLARLRRRVAELEEEELRKVKG